MTQKQVMSPVRTGSDPGWGDDSKWRSGVSAGARGYFLWVYGQWNRPYGWRVGVSVVGQGALRDADWLMRD